LADTTAFTSPAIWTPDDSRREVSLAGIDPNVFQDGGALIVRDGSRAEAYNALRGGGAVLVPDVMARRDEIAVGHTMRIGLPGQDPVELRVAGILEYTLPARSPDGALVISVLRDGSGFVPKADSVVEAGDEVLVVLDPGLEEDITRLFVSQVPGG
jgi:hypothetical protein